MYSDISNQKQSSNIYPDLKKDASIQACASGCKFSSKPSNPFFATQPNLRRHSKKKKKLDSTENDDKTKGSSWDLPKYIAAAMIIVGGIKYIHSTFQEPESKESLPQYLEEIEELIPNYGQQTDEFWNIIQSFPYFLLSDKNPEGPAVLLMVAPAGSLGLALQLTNQLTHILNKHLNSYPKHLKFIEGTSLTVQSPDDQKMMIDEQIRTLVDNQGQRAVVIVNLEKIDPKAIMIFHAYCDNSEAVYKNIAIILLLELPAEVHAKNNDDVFAYLSQIWSPLGRSRNHALFSRMANNIAILKAK